MSIQCMLTKFLTTDDLNYLCNNNKSIKKYFKGVFPADFYPELNFQKGGWIWNTDESNKPGQHWVAVWKTDDTMYFLTVFGLTLMQYNNKEWKKIAKKNNVKFEIFSYKMRQNFNTTTCGVWCLIFLLQKCTKMNLLSMIEDKKTLENDKKLLKLSVIFFPKMKQICMKKCRKIEKNNQKCCSYKNIFKK